LEVFDNSSRVIVDSFAIVLKLRRNPRAQRRALGVRSNGIQCENLGEELLVSRVHTAPVIGTIIHRVDKRPAHVGDWLIRCLQKVLDQSASAARPI
jgi:hypothetical protein